MWPCGWGALGNSRDFGFGDPFPESWAACMRSKITKVTLNSRFADQPLPVWQWVDTIAERLAGKMQGEFSTTLLEAIRHELKQGNQVILFKNRRVCPAIDLRRLCLVCAL